MRHFIKVILFPLCIIFFFSCIPNDDARLPSEQTENDNSSVPTDEEQSLKNQIVNQSLDKLQGIYQGAYETSRFEMWIEKIGQSENGEYIMAVLLFLENNKQEVQQFFTKYQDPDLYYKEICISFKASKSTDNPMNSPEDIELTGAKTLWNSIGALGKINFTLDKTLYFLGTRFFMVFQQQMRGFTSLYTNNAGFLDVSGSDEAQSVTLFSQNLLEKGKEIFKMENNYFIEVSLVKKSQPKTGLLNKYYQTVEAIKQKFKTERESHYRYYCPNFVKDKN